MPASNKAKVKIELPAEAAGLELDQYFGAWACEESRFGQMLHTISTMDIGAHLAANAQADPSAVNSEREQAVAILDVRGTLTKRGSSLLGNGTTRLRSKLRQLARDDDIGAIVLRIDSPGGTVAGTADFGEEVNAARQQKPVVAFVEDLAASAAYWIASQTQKVVANNRTAEIGSIGTYLGLYDFSRMAQNEGIEAVVIRTSPLKGAGFPGEEITDDQKAYFQEIVDAANKEFLAAVQSGRGMTQSQVEAVAVGRVWAAPEAQQLGLIDGIQSLDELVAELQRDMSSRRGSRRRRQSSTTQKRGKAMSEAAQYDDIVLACEGCEPKKNSEDSRFVCEQLEKGASVEDAQSAWMKELRDRSDKAAKEAEEAKKQAQEAKKEAEESATKGKGAVGVQPLEETASDSTEVEGAAEEFRAKVQEKVAKGMSRQRAVSRVNREDPDLRKRMVQEANAT